MSWKRYGRWLPSPTACVTKRRIRPKKGNYEQNSRSLEKSRTGAGNSPGRLGTGWSGAGQCGAPEFLSARDPRTVDERDAGRVAGRSFGGGHAWSSAALGNAWLRQSLQPGRSAGSLSTDAVEPRRQDHAVFQRRRI